MTKEYYKPFEVRFKEEKLEERLRTLESKVKDLEGFKEITVVIPNIKGEERQFTFKVTKRFLQVIWDYDKTGEPIDVRLIERD